MTRCTFCDHENPPGATSCAECHAELSDALDTAQQADVDPLMDLVRSGKKIEAIKIYRQRMGVGLKEAKDAIECLNAASRSASRRPSRKPSRRAMCGTLCRSCGRGK